VAGMAKPKPRDGSTLKGIIAYHEQKLEWNETELEVFHNISDELKNGQNKDVYDKMVSKHEKAIEFHKEAIKTLKDVVKCLDL